MLTLKVNAQKVLTELRQQFELERTQKELRDEQNRNNAARLAQVKIDDLTAEIKVLKAARAEHDAKVLAEAKSSYADHAMAINDERIKEMRAVYENYAKNIVDIVKASVQPASITVVPATTAPLTK